MLNTSTSSVQVIAIVAALGGPFLSTQDRDLGRLTVPQERLSPDCRPSTFSSERALMGPAGPVLVKVDQAPLPSSPWQGSDRTVLAALRSAVDGVPPTDEGLDATATITNALKWADDVAEGYGAIYVENGTRLGVYAIRYKDAKLASAQPPAGTTLAGYGPSERVVLGDTVVRIVAPRPVPCFRAISSYISSLQ